MLMVIFGAGASYDSVPSSPISFPNPPLRPPLADELFANRAAFRAAMSRFPKCLPVIPYLQAPGVAVERVLESLQAEAEEYAERHRQLAAIRYYLHYALWELQRGWSEQVAQGVTNYKTLLDQIQRWRKSGQQVCLATSNYDTMLEDALPTVGIGIQGMNDYIASEDYKIIKLHGSINWAREVEHVATATEIGSLNAWQVAYELIEHAPDLIVSQNYRVVTEYPIGRLDRKALFPALALPVETKRSFECPEEHLAALRQCIRRVSKLLIIGWRGMEDHFLRLLADNLPSGIPIVAVGANEDDAKRTLLRVEGVGVKGDFRPMTAGFSDFVTQRRGDDLLKS